MAFGVTLVLLFVTCCSLCYLFSDKILPPGPKFGLPGIGNLLDIALTKLPQHVLMRQWADRYGKVFSYWLGSEFMVVINDAKVARSAFSNDDLVDRKEIFNFWDPNGVGVVFSSGETWVDQKKVVIATFKNIENDRSLDKIVRTEIGCLISELKATCKRACKSPFNPQEILQKAVFNLVSEFNIGQRFSYDDKLLTNFMDLIIRKNEPYSAGAILAFFPSLKKTSKMAALLNKYHSLHQKHIQYCNEFVKQHKKKFDRNCPKDLIDSWFLELERKESQNMESTALSENNLISTILNTYSAGFQTLRLYLFWLILYMSAYPEIQRKMQTEIDAVVGRDRLPEMTDEPELPYTVAVVMEVLRSNPPVVTTVPHCATRDSYVQENFVPKGSIIIGNLYFMFQDPEIWQHPDEFIPERFIDQDGTFNPRSDVFTPFGVGRRACIGQKFARKVLFLFTASLMHQFNFELPANSPPVSFAGDVRTFNVPKPRDLVVTIRGAGKD